MIPCAADGGFFQFNLEEHFSETVVLMKVTRTPSPGQLKPMNELLSAQVRFTLLASSLYPVIPQFSLSYWNCLLVSAEQQLARHHSVEGRNQIMCTERVNSWWFEGRQMRQDLSEQQCIVKNTVKHHKAILPVCVMLISVFAFLLFWFFEWVELLGNEISLTGTLHGWVITQNTWNPNMILWFY